MSICELRAAVLDGLLAPMTREEFLDRHWDRAPLVQQGPADRVASLATVADADRLLARDPARLWIEHEAADLGHEPLRRAGPADVDQALGRFENGATLLVEEVERRLDRVARLCRTLTADLGFRCHGSLSVTPRNGVAAAPHLDAVGQVVLQLSGRRNWQFGPAATARPSPPARRVPAELPADAAEVTLEPGDLLYLPRGVPHALAASSEVAVHLALMIHAPAWRDAAAAALWEADGSEALGDLLPVGWWRMERDALTTELSRRWPRCPDAATARDVIDQLFARELRAFPVEMAGRLMALTNPRSAGSKTTFGARPDLMWDVSVTDRTARLICGPLTVDHPAEMAPAIRFCLTEGRYTADDLPTTLDMQARLELVRRLAAMQLVRRLDLDGATAAA